MNLGHSTRDDERSDAPNTAKSGVIPASSPSAPASPSAVEPSTDVPVRFVSARRTRRKSPRWRRRAGRPVPVHIQYLRFGMVGLTNAIVDLGVLNLLLAIHPTRKPVILLVDNTIAVTLAIVNSYLWNTRWTFSHEAKHTSGERALFIAQGLLNIITNNLVLLAAQALFQTRSGIWYILGSNAAKLIAMIIASSLSFVLLRTVVFRAQRHGHTPPASSADGSAPARQPETEREQRHGRSYEARSLKADGAYPHEPVPRQHIRRGSRQPHPPAHQARQAHLPPGDEPQPQQQTPRTPDARVRGASSH